MDAIKRIFQGDVYMNGGTIQAAFRDVMCAARNEEIDPLSSFPITNAQNNS